jgi:fibronectin type 3 domain-containing protein
MGYHIRQAHDPNDEAVLETGDPLLDTVYVDTLKIRSLTNESYYDVIALDQNSNQSDASRVRVRLPDVVPPTAPVIRSARPTPESVELAWTPSVSEDVAFHRVMRQSPADSVWSEHAELSGTGEAYTDTAVVTGRTYAYMIVAEDSAGLRSDGGVPVTARPYDTGIRPGVEALEVNAENGDVRLRWAYPNASDGPYWFIVYRAQGEGHLRRYLTAGEPAFSDPSTNADDAYRYAVQVMYEDGGQSRLSEIVEVDPR